MEPAGNFKAEASTNRQSGNPGAFGDWGEGNCISAAPRIRDAAGRGSSRAIENGNLQSFEAKNNEKVKARVLWNKTC